MAEFDVPLRVVTPHMKGIPVRDAQWLLSGHNRFAGLAPYKDGKMDEDYGPLTAQATSRAKFWLGYPNDEINGTFGQLLYEYLRPNDWRPLPVEYRERRTARMKAAAISPGAKAFVKAETYIGYKETPVNHSMFGKWYGLDGYPWCAMFVSYCYDHVGYPKIHQAAVEMFYHDAVANRNGLYIVRTPRRGDIVGYRLHGDDFAHTALFDEWVDSNTFVDLGGNTGPTNISNGGMVMRQNREKAIVKFYARVA